MSVALAVEKMLKKLEELEMKRAIENEAKTHHRADSRVRVHSVHIKREELVITIKQFYLPAYIFKSKESEDVYCMVSGYEGTFSGLQPLSSTRVGMAGSAIAFLMSLLIQASPNGMVMAVPLGYAVGHLWSVYYHYSDQKEFLRDKEEREKDSVNRLEEQQKTMVEFSKERVICMSEGEAKKLSGDWLRVYSKEEFVEVCEEAKLLAISSKEERTPRETVELLKEMDRIQSQVLKRHNLK